MSIIVASGEAISKHLQNVSKSKQMYSFSKSNRFDINTKNFSKTFYYNLPDVKMKRSTSLGYGIKFDFTKGNKWSAPHYDIPALFNDKKEGSPKYSFGLSREYFDKVVVGDTTSLVDKPIPGVGKYNIESPFGKESPKYSMVKRYPTVVLGSNAAYPGPGKYTDAITTNTNGKFPLSQFSNTAMNGWSKFKEKRFISNIPLSPGPSAYDIDYLIKGKSNVYNSKYNSPTSKSFSKRFKSIFISENNTPGPGTYTTFSEFGLYKSKHADEMERKARSQTYISNDGKKMIKSRSMADVNSNNEV